MFISNRRNFKKKKVTLQEIQSLCGLLNFACQEVVPGRAFLRRLFELTYGLKKAHHRVKLNRGCKDDLQVWKTFLEQFNGKCFFIDETWVYSDKFLLFTDASGVHGYGVVFEKSWFYGSWNKEWLSYNITVNINLRKIVKYFKIKRFVLSCYHCFKY